MHEPLSRYAQSNGYPVEEWAKYKCKCGEKNFNLFFDADEGGAYIVCVSCQAVYDLYESKRYIEDEVQNICTCKATAFEIFLGRNLHPQSKAPRWTYIGASCPKCNLQEVYVDWQEW